MPVREHARLARAGAGEDQQRPLAVRDGLALGLVEALEQVRRCARRRRRPACTLEGTSGERRCDRLARMAACPTRSARRCAQIAATRALGARSTTSALGGARRPAPPPAARPRAPLPRGLAARTSPRTSLTLDAINFGSGWFPTLRKRPGLVRLLHGRLGAGRPLPRGTGRGRTPSCARMRRRRGRRRARPGPRDHELMALYAQALRELGALPRRARRARRSSPQADGSAERARRAARATGMPLLRRPRLLQARADRGRRPRARRASPTFDDLDRLTIFADNLVPHVLRVRRRARATTPRSRRTSTPGELLRAGPAGARDPRLRRARLRAARRAHWASRRATLDVRLWNRGQDAAVQGAPAPPLPQRLLLIARPGSASGRQFEPRASAAAAGRPRERRAGRAATAGALRRRAAGATVGVACAGGRRARRASSATRSSSSREPRRPAR